jgi:hypothetical protein
MKRQATIGAVALLLTGIAACAGSPRTGSAGLLPADAPPQIQRGHGVYITDCASCHRAREPRTYSRERWDAALPRMEAKARLSGDDSKALEAYIAASLSSVP